MTPRPSLRGSAPAFLAGIALAMGTQVGAGLLLYGGPGFLPALSVILATAAASLALGLASREQGSVEVARRAWLVLLLSFTAAVVFSGAWQLFRGFGARPLTQGLGLALLVALPLYLGGRLLAQLGTPASGTRPPGPPALVGGAVGLLVLGHVFFPALSPTAVLLLCVVAVSGGALAHGWLLDELVREEFVDTGEPGLVVRRSRRIRPPMDVLSVEEARAVRLVRGGDGGPLLPLDVGLEVGLLPTLPPPETVLAIGWRVLPAATRVAPAGAAIALVHPRPERARTLLSSLPGSPRPPEEVDFLGAAAAACLLRGAPEPSPGPTPESVPGSPHAADWLLVDAAELDTLGDQRWSRLRGLLRPGGTLVVVGATEPAEAGGGNGKGALDASVEDAPDGSVLSSSDRHTEGAVRTDGLLAPLRAGAAHFGSAGAYVGPTRGEEAEGTAGPETVAGREGLLVFAREAGRVWPDTAGRLLLVLPGED